jgi:dephospho-CoA kinase
MGAVFVYILRIVWYHKDMKEVKILAIVGMTGSGKSTAVEYLKKKGIPNVYFGGIMHQAMIDEGWEVSSDGDKKYPHLLREKYGKDFVVQRAVDEIKRLIEAGQRRILIDGLYSWTEYKILKRAFPGNMTVLALAPPRHLRYDRLKHRSDRPYTTEAAQERDWYEIENTEKGGPIAQADYCIVNTGSISETRKKLDKILAEIEFLA